MGRSQNWAYMSRAIREGHITTDADRSRIAAIAKQKAISAAAHRASRAQGRARDTALLSLTIGTWLVLSEYVATSQVGMLKQRLARNHGAFYTVKAIPGEGVRFERINPPYAAPASDYPNGDLL